MRKAKKFEADRKKQEREIQKEEWIKQIELFTKENKIDPQDIIRIASQSIHVTVISTISSTGAHLPPYSILQVPKTQKSSFTLNDP